LSSAVARVHLNNALSVSTKDADEINDIIGELWQSIMENESDLEAELQREAKVGEVIVYY
jgi:hypothetical protein